MLALGMMDALLLNCFMGFNFRALSGHGEREREGAVGRESKGTSSTVHSS